MSNTGGIDSAQPKQRNDSLKLHEVIDIYDFQKESPDEDVQVRLLAKGWIAVARHWCKIQTNGGKQVSVPRYCLNYDTSKGAHGDGQCPYCDHDLTKQGAKGEDSPVTTEYFYLTNAIIRDLQENEPAKKLEPSKEERKTGHKQMSSKTWTPVRVIRCTNKMVLRIQEIGSRNTVKVKGEKTVFPITHPKHGVDIIIKYKPAAPNNDKYSIDKAEDGRTPLTEKEDKYLVYRLDEALLIATGLLALKAAVKDLQGMTLMNATAIDEDDDDSHDLGSKKKKKKRSDAFDDDDDEDEDDRPKKKKKSKSSFDDDDDDEPVKKKKKKRTSDDDDEDEDDRPKKKKKKRSEDDDDDEPVKKKKKKRPSDDDDEEDDRPKKKKKRSSDDDDDDDRPKKKKKRSDDDDDDEDDRPKKKKKRSSDDDDEDDRPKKKKKRSDDDDDIGW